MHNVVGVCGGRSCWRCCQNSATTIAHITIVAKSVTHTVQQSIPAVWQQPTAFIAHCTKQYYTIYIGPAP